MEDYHEYTEAEETAAFAAANTYRDPLGPAWEPHMIDIAARREYFKRLYGLTYTEDRFVPQLYDVHTQEPVGLVVSAKVVDDDTYESIRDGFYTGYSVGADMAYVTDDNTALMTVQMESRRAWVLALGIGLGILFVGLMLFLLARSPVVPF